MVWWWPFLLQLTSNRIQPASEGPKPYTDRSSAIQTHTATPVPTAICLWNTLPVDVCQVPPDSFKAKLNSVQLMEMPVGLVSILGTASFLSVQLLPFVTDCTTASTSRT